MSKQQEIADLIYNELDYVYCNNCRGSNEIQKKECSDDDFCEDCYRKYMGWEISKAASEKIAEKIMEIMAK